MRTTHGFMARLRPEARETYLTLHRAVPAEIIALIRRAGITAYRIYERGGWLFATYVHDGDDHDRDLAGMIADPAMQRWWAQCVPCFDCADPAQPWLTMDEAWAL